MFKAENLNILNKGNKLVFNSPVSFTINSHEIWTFRGPNGIGKSSVYESLIGLRNINEGTISLNDIILNNLKPSKRINLGLKYVSQKNAMFDNLSVKKNLKVCAEYLLPSKERNDAVERAIQAFKLEDIAYKLPSQLSGGQQRIAELSKILIGTSSLVLMDEPFAAIDPNKIDFISEVITQLKETGMSFFINDHNENAVKKISDHELVANLKSTKIQKIQK